jgi:hypothetical protein
MAEFPAFHSKAPANEASYTAVPIASPSCVCRPVQFSIPFSFTGPILQQMIMFEKFG